MQQLNPSEISEVIKKRIEKLDVSSEARNEGTIVSVSDGDIVLAPDGTGQVVIDDSTWPASDGTTGQILSTDGVGNLSWIDSPVLADETTPNLGGDLDVDGYSIISNTNGNIDEGFVDTDADGTPDCIDGCPNNSTKLHHMFL